MNCKLKHYYVKGVFIEPGNYIDRHGHNVEFTPDDKFYINDIVPIYYNHDGPIVGFVTSIYKANNKLCFDGYVFDATILNKLMSNHPGVSVELISTDNGFLITGMALTMFPAINSAKLCEVIALSSIRTELTKYLTDNKIENAEQIAALVEKFLVQFKYPTPEKLEEAAETITELSKQNETLEDENKALKTEVESVESTIKTLIAEFEKTKELHDNLIAEFEKTKEMQTALVNDIKKVKEEILTEIEKLKMSKTPTEEKKKESKDEKLEFSVNESNTNTDAWDAAIEMYLKRGD